MMVRGIRGATTTKQNSAEDILSATRELLMAMVDANSFVVEDIVSVIITMTPDLNAAFPALAARQIGWRETPLLGATEIDHPNGLKRCIRVLIQINTAKKPSEIRHIYLRDAVCLRSDLTES